jgi:hypothetical protein
MFNNPTRRALQLNLVTFGEGFAARGPALNHALGEVQPLVDNLLPVMSNLLATQTRWRELFPSLEQAAREVVDVANRQGQLYAGLDATFTPLSQATPSLQASITGGPAALRTAARQLPAQARFVNDSAHLFHRLRPVFVKLGQASAQLAPAEAAGIPVLHRAPALNGRLTATLQAIQKFAEDTRTLPGLVLLTETARLLEPTVAFIEPEQTSCNYLALFFRNLESAVSESDAVGAELDVEPLSLPQLPNSEAGPASAPADGPPASAFHHLTIEQQSLIDDSFLHSDPYPFTSAPGQPGQCEAGNELYQPGKVVIGNGPVLQRATEKTKRVLP